MDEENKLPMMQAFMFGEATRIAQRETKLLSQEEAEVVGWGIEIRAFF